MSDPAADFSDSDPEFQPIEEPAERVGEGGVKQLLRRIREELDQRRGKEAVRTFLEGQSQGAIPSHDGLLRWMTEQLGEDATRRLVAAFAHFPCVACSGGLEPCGFCEGSGIRAEGVVCETCIGGGRVRCDFCAGSGLATYNLVPPALRRGTISHRVHMAQRAVEKLGKSALPSDPAALLNFVLSGNKLLCLLENAVTGARARAAERAAPDASLEQLIDACHAAARAVDARLREALRALADASARIGAEQSSLKADYYRNLADSDTFERTILHHPLLRENGGGEAAAQSESQPEP
jgi:hypothetical protein